MKNVSLFVLSLLAGAASVAAVVLVTNEVPRAPALTASPAPRPVRMVETRDEANELLAANSRERALLRLAIQRELADLDENTDAKSIERREILEGHLDMIDGVSDREWDVVKSQIERSLI